MNRAGKLMTILLAGWIGQAAASHEVAISEDQLKSLGIALARVEPAIWVASDRLPARVVIPPRQERVVSAPSAGLVTSLQVGLGDEVKEGDELARIESPPLIALQREFLQAATEVRLAATALKRDKQLFKEGIIAERRYLETRGAYEQATATLDERRQALALAGMDEDSIKRLERTRKLASGLTVFVPMAGVVLEQMAVVGQRVDRADPIYRLARLEPLWLEIRVPLNRLQGVETGTAVELPCPDSTATVTLIGRNIDPDTQTVMVRAELHDAARCLRPGQFVEARLKLGGAEKRFKVPSSAVVRGGENALVFVRAPFGFLATEVKVVGQEGLNTIVIGPFKGGEAVAVSGLAAIKAAWLGLGGGE